MKYLFEIADNSAVIRGHSSCYKNIKPCFSTKNFWAETEPNGRGSLSPNTLPSFLFASIPNYLESYSNLLTIYWLGAA